MKLTLNLGCGERTFEEYPEGYKCINYDERGDLPNLDKVGDVKDLPFPAQHFDYVMASDIIEHFPITDTDNLVSEWARVLKNSGIMEIRTPNLKWAAEHYVKHKDAKFISYHVFGGQDYSGNFHYVIFDRHWIKQILSKFNLVEIDYEEKGSNFIIKAMKLKGD